MRGYIEYLRNDGSSPKLTDASNLAPLVKLNVEVAVSSQSMGVTIREQERDCICTHGDWLEVGECQESSDVVRCDCDPLPALCVERVRLRFADGTPEVSKNYLSPQQLYLPWETASPGAEATLEIVGCGGVMEIPITHEEPPSETVDFAARQEEVEVRWSSSPEASQARIVFSDGEWLITRCMDDTGSVTFPYDPRKFWSTSVTPYSGPLTVSGRQGTARVWFGKYLTRDLEPPVATP